MIQNNIKEQFIPYNEALVLKELGFNEQCMRFYSSKNGGTLVLPERMSNIHNTVNSSVEILGYCAAPLWQQAFDWFREEHGLSSTIISKMHYDVEKNVYLINELKNRRVKSKFFKSKMSKVYKDYSEAREACLERLIKTAENYEQK